MFRGLEDAMTLLVVCVLLALTATVLAFIFITPEKKRASLPKFLKILHDIANFKGLFIELIVKALYIFVTVFVILFGFFMIFVGGDFLGCLLTMVLGPIAIRLGFEASMMLILLVKNVISINNKLRSQTDEADADMGFDFSEFKAAPQQPVYQQPVYQQPVYEQPVAPQAPVAPVAPAAPAAPVAAFCPNCGTKVDGAFCPNCGKPMGQ